MNEFKKNIITALVFMTGIYDFIAGEFVLASVLFAGATVYSNVWLTRRLNK